MHYVTRLCFLVRVSSSLLISHIPPLYIFRVCFWVREMLLRIILKIDYSWGLV